MTKPRKWYLKKDDDGVILHYYKGPIKKPNASGVLGAVVKLTLPSTESRGKISEKDALLVSDIT
jgi:hypothetical protein